jgi:hypothetical protein
MTTRRTRAFLAVPFAFVLLPIFSLLVARTAPARPHATMSWTPADAKAPAAFQGVHLGTIDTPAHAPAPMPYAPAWPLAYWRSSPTRGAVSSVEHGSRAVAFARLYPARAPPEI